MKKLSQSISKCMAMLVLVGALMPLTAYAEHDSLYVEADRPGMGTGTHVLPFGAIQWESGFECTHAHNMHIIVVPTTLFRFGLGPWAELRLEYTGKIITRDQRNRIDSTSVAPRFDPDPLFIGSKIRLWEGSDAPRLKWLPRTSILLNIGAPLTRAMAESAPLLGEIDLLFEHDPLDWLNIGYDLGIHWDDWAPIPNIFASLALNFSPTEKLGVFIESYNYFDPDAFDVNNPTRSYTSYDINLDFGLTYMVHPHVQLEAYAGFNLYHSESVLSGPRNNVCLGIGVAWLLYAK